MRIAILSAGPSLLATWDPMTSPRRYDCTIAVNRAILCFDADWLAAGDACTLIRLTEHPNFSFPRSGVWTMRDVAKTPPPGWDGVEMRPFEHLPGWRDLARPGNWSIQAALAGAGSLGATAVTVYGHDCAGVQDASGDPGEQRNPDRWQREALDWAASEHWALSQGIALTTVRHTPPGARHG